MSSVACFLLPQVCEWVEDGMNSMLGADPEDARAEAVCSEGFWVAVTAAFRAGPVRFFATVFWAGVHCFHVSA